MTGIELDANSLNSSIEKSIAQLSQAIDIQKASEEFQAFLNIQARFPRYSWRNCWLITMIKPEATLVAGFQQWKRLGRSVKKGEKAIRIMAPCPVRRENPDTGDEEDRLFFKTACVWDVLQTEGKELPDYDVPEVSNDAEHLLRCLEKVAVKRGITVTYQQLSQGHYGTSKGGQIDIATGHSSGQQAKSLAHELAHEFMHYSQGPQTKCSQAQSAKEMEAEAVAYVVCRHFSLDVKLRASRYITLWGGDAKALADSMGKITITARQLINDVHTINPKALTLKEIHRNDSSGR